MGLVRPRYQSEIIPTSKQRGLLFQQEENKIKSIRQRVTESSVLKKSPPMGGGSYEEGGDGTGFAGGVDLYYWEERLKNFSALRRSIGSEPIEGQDYPSPLQMEKARNYYRARSKENL